MNLQLRKYIRIDNLLLIIVFMMISIFTFSNGPIMSSDTYQYISWAELLIENSFNLKNFAETELIKTPSFFYIVNTIIFSVFLLLSPENWKDFFMLLNCISVAVILINIKLILDNFTTKKMMASFAFILFMFSDILLWPSYILLDTFYTALVLSIISIYIILKSNIKYVLIVFALIILTFTKPQSLAVLIGFIMVSLLLNEKVLKIYKNYRLIISAIITLICSLFFSFIFFTDISLVLNSSEISVIKDMIFKGEVIRDRPETWFKSPESVWDTISLFYYRLYSFFQIWVQDFSLLHNLMYFILNILFILSVAIYLKKDAIKFNDENFKALSVLFLMILGGGIFHSLTLIDHDWRYKFVYVPQMCIFIVIIFDALLEKYNIKY